MVMYAYFLWLAAAYVIACGPDGDEMHRLLLGLVPFVGGFAFALQVTRPFTEIHSMLRWLGVPLFLLLPFALRSVWNVFQTVNLNAAAICTDHVPPTWQTSWAPLQMITLLFALYMIVRVWRSVAQDKAR
jgi:beta-lactamase regulating signal transducer with metallopeptidase domain